MVAIASQSQATPNHPSVTTINAIPVMASQLLSLGGQPAVSIASLGQQLQLAAFSHSAAVSEAARTIGSSPVTMATSQASQAHLVVPSPQK